MSRPAQPLDWKKTKVSINLYYEAEREYYQRLLDATGTIRATVEETTTIEQVLNLIRHHDPDNRIWSFYHLSLQTDIVKIRIYKHGNDPVVLSGTNHGEVIWTKSVVDTFTQNKSSSGYPLIMVVMEPVKSKDGNLRFLESRRQMNVIIEEFAAASQDQNP